MHGSIEAVGGRRKGVSITVVERESWKKKEKERKRKRERERKIMPQTESKKQTPLTERWIPDPNERNQRRRSRVEAEEA